MPAKPQPSMFSYCTEVLHLSEAKVYLRIAAARASREHPLLLERPGRRAVTPDGHCETGAAPHNWRTGEALIERASHRSKRGIEELVAEISPGRMPAVIRKLPTDGTGRPQPKRALAQDLTRKKSEAHSRI